MFLLTSHRSSFHYTGGNMRMAKAGLKRLSLVGNYDIKLTTQLVVLVAITRALNIPNLAWSAELGGKERRKL